MQRYACWLLQVHDRVGSDEMVVRQEFLAALLGVRRAAVKVAADRLQTCGPIAYRRGHVTILDRAGLEDAARECYRIIATAIDEMLGPRS
jgi:hypothetical protein